MISLEFYVPLNKDIKSKILEEGLAITIQYGNLEKNLWRVCFSYEEKDLEAQTFLLNKFLTGEIFQSQKYIERYFALKGLT